MSADHQPGPLIGAGRAADVYALDGDRALRRYRRGHSAEPEAAVMTYLEQAGYPVPGSTMPAGRTWSCSGWTARTCWPT